VVDHKHEFAENCECTVIHEEVVEGVRDRLLDPATNYALAELFKVLGDPTRIRIINALFLSEMCVCDISALLGMTQSAISHQLKVLRQTRLVKFRKEGKVVYYSLDDEHIKQIFDLGLIHIRE